MGEMIHNVTILYNSVLNFFSFSHYLKKKRIFYGKILIFLKFMYIILLFFGRKVLYIYIYIMGIIYIFLSKG